MDDFEYLDIIIAFLNSHGWEAGRYTKAPGTPPAQQRQMREIQVYADGDGPFYWIRLHLGEMHIFWNPNYNKWHELLSIIHLGDPSSLENLIKVFEDNFEMA